MKIRLKLLILFIITAMVPLFFISVLSFSNAKETLEKSTVASLNVIAGFKGESVLLYLKRLRTRTNDFSSDGFVRDSVLDIAQKGLVSLDRSNSESIGDGLVRIDKKSFFVVEELNAYLKVSKKEAVGKDLIEIDVINANGIVCASSDEKRVGMNMSQKDLFLKGKTEVYIAEPDPVNTKIDNKISIPVSAPLKDRILQTAIGVIVYYYPMDQLDRIMAGEKNSELGPLSQISGIGKTGETYLVARNGKMINASLFIKDSAFKQKVDTYPVKKCFEENKEVNGIWRDYRGELVVGASKSMRIGDFKWALISEQNVTEAFASIESLKNLSISTGVVTVFLVIAVALSTAKLISDPIRKLTKDVEIIGKGNLDHRTMIKTRDEISQLGTAFNSMAGKLKESYSGLEKKIKEKTRELAQSLAQSEQHKRDLEEVNLELDSFVYSASHDLRAPLRAIASFATFLEEDYKDKIGEEGAGYLKEIRDGVRQMDGLIKDLLALSRITRIKNPYEDVNMNDLIKTIMEWVEFDVKQYKVDLIVQKDMPIVECDRVKMGQVFLNLVDNAIKFSHKAQKNPKVEVGYKDKGEFHEFFVKDSGIGIAPQYHNQIFGLFKRLHAASQYKGTGAGLCIVKRIIDGHAGDIWVESELGKGATFCFTIPKDLKERKKIGEILLGEGHITEEQLERALKKQRGNEPQPPDSKDT